MKYRDYYKLKTGEELNINKAEEVEYKDRKLYNIIINILVIFTILFVIFTIIEWSKIGSRPEDFGKYCWGSGYDNYLILEDGTLQCKDGNETMNFTIDDVKGYLQMVEDDYQQRLKRWEECGGSLFCSYEMPQR